MLILGHRGAASAACPENTLASVDRALRQGADGVEIDVRLTADGVAVCHHDAHLRRTAKVPAHLVDLRFSELPRVQGQPIPRLAEMLELTRGRGQLVVELKTPRWPAGAATLMVHTVAAELRRHRLQDVVVSSFDRPRLLQLRQLGLGCRTGLLTRQGVPLALAARRARVDGHDEVHPHVTSVLPAVGARQRELGDLTVWTVNRPTDLAALAAAGVGAVICDDPAAALRSLSAGIRLAG